MQRYNAFTLIELLMVMTIVGILSAIGLPALMHFWQRANDEILSSSIVASLTFAQQEAIARHERIGVCLSDARMQCEVGQIDRIMVFVEPQKILAVTRLKLSSGQLHWRAFPFYRPYVLFTSSPSASSDNATFWYCRKRETMPAFAVVLGQTGMAHIQLPNRRGVIKTGQGKLLTC